MPSTARRDLAAFLARLAAGATPGAAEISILSDLSREEAEDVRELWRSIPAELRASVVSRATELAEDNADLTFTRLALVALDDTDATVRSVAAAALWEAEDRIAATRLRDVLTTDRDEEVRAAAAASLRHFVSLREFDEFDRLEGDAIVVALRRAVEDATESIEVRALALEALGMRSLSWVADLIAEVYIDDHPRLRLAAVRAMGDSADEGWLEYLHGQLDSDEPEFRFEAVVALAGIASEDSIEPLSPLLDDEDLQIALAAVEALGEIGGQRALDALAEFAPRAPEAIAEAVPEAMENAREGGVNGFTSDVVEDDDEE